MDIYAECPSFENSRYLLRAVQDGDTEDLLLVYGDEKAVPFFNSDNCHGDDFHYTTPARMRKAIDFWKQSYQNGQFVRWTIVDKAAGTAIGTAEAFRREAQDYFTDCALLRLDLRSDYETSPAIAQIISLIAAPLFDLFGCGKVATKAVPAARERIAALRQRGFSASPEKLVGHDGTAYGDYFVLLRDGIPAMSVRETLLALEKRFFRKEFCADRERIASALHDNFLECGKSGFLTGKAETVESLSAAPRDRAITVYNFTCEALGGGYWLAHYVTASDGGLFFRTSIWKKEADWRLYFHQASPLHGETVLHEC